MADPIIYGADYSTYVRTARLAHEEKGVGYTLEPVDIFSGQSHQPAHLARHPFGKVPAYEHDGFRLYEVPAIMRYVDLAFDGPALLPADAKRAARATQVTSVVDNYGYPCLLGTIVWQRMIVPMTGGEPDVAQIDGAQERAATVLRAIADIQGDDPWLAGPEPTLADLSLAPIFAYFTQTPDAEALLAPHAGLRRWWETMQARDSMARTAPNL
jgi:glutathione S-transferase